MRLRKWLLLVVAAALFAAAAASAHANVVWLCKPGDKPDPCAGSQRTTIEAEYSPSTVVDPKVPKHPPIDCFYVYPTVSEQPGVNADKAKDAPVVGIARYQAARFSLKCRVFAPIYRQLTLGSIFSGSPEARAKGRKIAYGDVREAWRDYLRRYNHGRGVVLIGHSQGTGMLRQLMRDEIDPKRRVRKRLVSALLLGGNVLVSDFAHIPLCAARAQAGCVVAYSTFEDDPPDDALFGRAPGPQDEVACTNPASLGANARAPLVSLLRSKPIPGILGVSMSATYGGSPPSAGTPWVQPGERYTARCEHVNGAHVLMAEPIGSARHLNASPSPTWGLHLLDANLPLGNLVRLVGRQSRAFRHGRG